MKIETKAKFLAVFISSVYAIFAFYHITFDYKIKSIERGVEYEITEYHFGLPIGNLKNTSVYRENDIFCHNQRNETDYPCGILTFENREAVNPVLQMQIDNFAITNEFLITNYLHRHF